MIDSTESEGESLVTDDEYIMSKVYKGRIIKVSRAHSLYEPLQKRCIIENPAFNSALDRTKTSTRKGIIIVVPALVAAGVDVNQLTL